MAKCPHCNNIEIDYNLIVHYPEKVNYFIEKATLAICFNCHNNFYITACGPHFYDRLYTTIATYNKIKQQYYKNNALHNSIQHTKVLNKYICLQNCYSASNFVKDVVLILAYSTLKSLLQNNVNLTIDAIKKSLYNLHSVKVNHSFNIFIADYQRYFKNKKVSSKLSAKRCYNLLTLILTMHYLIPKQQKQFNQHFINNQKVLYNQLNCLIQDI